MSDTHLPARPTPELATMVAAYNQMNHYGRANGMALAVSAPGQAEYRMTIQEEHLSSPNTCHGGVLAGLMDAALGASALSLAFTSLEFVSTVEFKMNYLHAVHLHDVLVAKGTVDHTGKKLIVSSCVIYRVADGKEDVAVARGLGTFNRYPANKRDFANLVMQQDQKMQ
ncbi:PaaI family thioesterase [Hymenobacter sp. BT770]|uniref:PaaI family thioesterase n=1 Tax=Hymenobacter sp. BT770 TaxID=2886942 RepID=UPI001D1182B8|nr:PaaI family thioesterase [Hymenobacter sp. BT770]MCC3153237.1 PaaI family thioesterase [Hymenobacter sp. BT770]MDO3414232.1 PaaI family thioesterase [Hymenobacter sp. BT770]